MYMKFEGLITTQWVEITRTDAKEGATRADVEKSVLGFANQVKDMENITLSVPELVQSVTIDLTKFAAFRITLGG